MQRQTKGGDKANTYGTETFHKNYMYLYQEYFKIFKKLFGVLEKEN